MRGGRSRKGKIQDIWPNRALQQTGHANDGSPTSTSLPREQAAELWRSTASLAEIKIQNLTVKKELVSLKILLTVIIFFIALPLFFNALGQSDSSLKLYPIRLKGKAGYIDNKGQGVIKPRFMRAWEFSEGLAPVQVNDDPVFGYVNQHGNFVIGPWHGTASVFSEGVGRVSK